MADTLGELISKLHSQMSSNSPQRGLEAENVVLDLSTFCLQNVSEAELAYCSSLLFHEESGVITFMKKSVLHDQFTEAKVQLLKFLTAYVDRIGKRVNPYAVAIKEICVTLFSQDRASKVKVETFPLLVQLLELRLEAYVIEQLNVAKLIDKYLKASLQPTKHTSTVKFWLYLLVGKFAEFFPEHTIAHSERLVSMYVNLLKDEMFKKSKKPDMQVISGCLQGLSAYLVNFTHSVEEGSKYSAEIFKFTRLAIDPQVSLSRYDVPKAGLHLLSKHARQFKEYLSRDHEVIFGALFRWCQHKNADARRAGFAAMNSFLKEVSEFLVCDESERNKSTFKAFVKRFRGIIDSNTSNTWEMSTAIRGYGYFAKPCKVFMKDDDIKFMFREMVQRSEQIYFSQENLRDDYVQHLPVFLEAISCIIEELDEVSDAFTASLERFVVILFDHFPKLAKGPKFLCYKALVQLLFSLSGKGAILKGFLSQVVYQALIRSCFHPVALEEASGVDFSAEGDAVNLSSPKVSYKDYLQLWEHLLDKTKFKDLRLRPGDDERWDVMHDMVYDELIQAILRVIHKLDFSFTKDPDLQGDFSDPEASVLAEVSTSDSGNQGLSATDPVAGLEPRVPKDYLVFINLVEFCKSILPRLCVNSFEKWIYVFGKDIIIMSTRFPVVSGFYKLLEVCMRVCTKVSFFKEVKAEREPTEEDMEMENVDTSDCLTCFALFRKFIKEVLSKMTQYKDDLLRSCLELVLALPREMVAHDVTALCSALKETFKLGLGYLPLAEAGLNALEDWTLALPPKDLEPIFKEILPCLDDYLRTSSVTDDESKTLASSAAPSKKRKVLPKAKETAQQLGTETALSKFRFRVLQFLGRLGGQTNARLLGENGSVDPASAMAWDSEKHLSFAVPFHDMKPTIHLDPFLPQVVELAKTSSDRQTKVAACELLHSLVLYMLGKSVTQPDGGKKSPMEKLWKRVFPVMLQLACDVEQVAEQLFKPLVFQLIHWFTNNKKFESPETMAILDAILDGIIHQTDAALRDFSAQCVREFLQWSLKQTSEKQLTKSQLNIKSLLKRVYSLALHPSASKRLGAALALNSILTVFREESALVDIFTLEILITFLESLALAHGDDPALGTQDQCVQVVSNLTKIVRKKANLLNKESKHRRVPRAFQNIPTITLSHLLPWLVKHCGKAQSECRHQCMKLVCQLAPLLPGTKSAAHWMQNTYQERKTFFTHRFEGGGGGKSGILNYTTLPSIAGIFSLKETYTWFDFLLAALDCYTWCFGERLLSPTQVFAAPPKEAKYSSVLFQSLEFFLSKLAMFGISSAAQCFPVSAVPSNTDSVFSPKEMDEYHRAKCTVIVRLMDFVTVLLNQDDALKIVPASFWSDDLFNIVLCCILEPGVIGFNMGDVQVIEKLPGTTGALCTTFVRKLPSEKVEQFKDCLRKKMALGSHCNLFGQLAVRLRIDDEERLDHLRLAHLLQGYQQLHSAGLLLAAVSHQGSVSPAQLSGKLLDCVRDALRPRPGGSSAVTQLSPATQQLFAALLQLAFALGLKHDDLMKCIFHESQKLPGDAGLAFYNTFKSELNGLFIRNGMDHIPALVGRASIQPSLVSSILSGILDQLAQDKDLRKRYGPGVCSVLLDSWGKLSAWWTPGSSSDLKHLALMLLTKMLSLDAKIVADPGRASFPAVFDTYLFFLVDPNAPLSFKGKAIHLLPYFTSIPADHLSKLRSHLDRFVADSFPLKSTEFIRGSPKYNEYIAALDQLLSAFVTSGSLTLLGVLLTIICREATHAHEDHIQACIVAFITGLRSSPSRAKDAVDVCLEVFLDDRDHYPEARRSVIDRVCVPFLLHCSIQALKDVFTCHIREIMSIVEGKLVKASDPNFESQLVSRLCCFKLLEVLYTRLSKTDLNSPESAINKAHCTDVKTGKELTMAITKCAHAAKSEDMRGESLHLELRRHYHCAAYNTLVALISCTQTEAKFYVGFLFTENVVKGQFLFDNLLDCNRTYEFEVELSTPVSRKKQMTSIRMDARAQTADGDNEGEGSPQGGPVYLSSQYLVGSSLSEDVSLYDFSTPVQAYASTDISQSRTRPEDAAVKEKQPSSSTEEEMEMDELNQHECMSKLIGLVRHLRQMSKSKGISGETMPSWMSALHKKFCDMSTHTNVQLFIAKLIVNEPTIFQPYAKFWLSPLMELLLSFGESDRAGTAGLNYFVVDLLVTMLSWSPTAIPEDTEGDRRLASRLVEFLMSRCEHSTRSVFRSNLEIIRTMVEVWKDRILVPTRVIFEALCRTDPNKKDNVTGIQLLGIVLANKLSPFLPASDVSEEGFCTSLINNLTFKYKEVHSAAAEVTGMLIKHLDETTNDDSLCDKVVSKLSPMMRSGNMDTGKFITCVNRLQLHYPPIADRFINQILYLLPTVHGDFKTQCLEVILARVEHIPDLFTELKNKGLKELLAHRDEGSQIACLRILQRLLKTLRVQELQFTLPSVTAFMSHPSSACRELMYDILIWIFDTYSADETFRVEEGAVAVLATAKDFLLQGLADDSKELKLKLRNFWSDEHRLPNTTLERLVEILRAMYSPNTEAQYLSYTTNLILHLTSVSPDFNRMMFEQPLSECKFEEYPIDYAWHKRHLVMTPLFAATQGSTLSSQSQVGQSLEQSAGRLRATQEPQFTPTQASGRPQTYDWLNPSSQDSGLLPSQTAGTTQSSLLFNPTKIRSQTWKPVPADFGSQRLQDSQGVDQTDGPSDNKNTEILRLKRRFLKDQSSRDVFFAKQEIKWKKLREQALERQKAAREARVVMYRTYRAGDLPDIQIKHSELIAPLQAVAQCDNKFAKLLFSSLFRGISSQIEEKLTETEANSLTQDINQALREMVSSSTQYFPPFISSVQDICYREPKLSLEATSVTSSCVKSFQEPIGIMLLEKQLLRQDTEQERPPKRARLQSAVPSATTTSWIELSKLYRQLGDYDALRGIFSGHIGAQAITRRALEAESRGDFAEALKLYNEAMECEDWSGTVPQQEEEDLWDEARLQCFANLTQWENLEQFSTLNIDEDDPPDLEKIWTNAFYQDHYLPFIFCSKLKRWCQGSSDNTQGLVTFITNALKTKDRAAHLEDRYSDSLALLYILKDDFDRARYYAEQASRNYLTDWAGLDVTMAASRSTKLQSLQKITEMQEFLDFFAEEGNFTSTAPALQLLQKWSTRFPNEKLHAISVWDDIITNRCMFMDKILNKFGRSFSGQLSDSMDVDESTDKTPGQSLQQKFLEAEIHFQLHMATTAKEQANFPVAVKYLKEALKAIPEGCENLRVVWTHTYVEVQHSRAKLLTAVEAAETALRSAEELDKYSSSRAVGGDSGRLLRHHILKSRTLDIITRAVGVDEGLVLSALDESRKQSLANICGADAVTSSKKVVGQLMIQSFSALQTSIKAAKECVDKRHSNSSEDMVQALMAMVKFCDDALKKKEDDPTSGPEVDVKLFPEIVVRYMLKAMRHDSDEARQSFPRLLQLVELYPDTLQTFISKAQEVPCWMFIAWINQMVALLDKREGKAVHSILQDIARKYPQALCYPFKISSERFQFGSSEDDKLNEEAVKRLKQSLELPLLDNFISALEQLTNPDMVFKDWCEGEMRPLLENASKRNDREAVKRCFSEIKRLFDHKTPRASSSSSQSVGSDSGAFRRRFAQEFAGLVERAFGKDGEKLAQLNSKTFSRMYSEIHNKMKHSIKAPGNLKEYSPWLSNFQASNHPHTMEIPGQYTGRMKPLPEYHVKIAGFDERVLVMSSIRAPKRLIIRGDDEKDHMFLVKGGEDLRLDQRIEQLFGLMNDVMAEDPSCSQRGLRLRTYQVVPMTPRVGLIEWMENTIPLKQFLLDAMTDAERKQYTSVAGPKEHQGKFLGKFQKSNKDAILHLYGQMYKGANRTETERMFKQCQDRVPWDLLRRAFERLAASPQAYLTLRSHFISTHACLSICQYVLGIGDRHLSNFMVDMQTGGMVGIDFGHAFGSATQFLPVPELMPFRLTRQFTNLLLPLKHTGTLQNTMVHTLRALRSNHEILLNTMDVFIKEPSLDWQVNAKKQMETQGTNQDSKEDTEWYPKQKIMNARRKLEGANPAHLTREDLRLNLNSKRPWGKDMEAVCMGDAKVNIRAREQDSGLSVEVQVACLIDQATDPNILGRTYQGWEPWV